MEQIIDLESDRVNKSNMLLDRLYQFYYLELTGTLIAALADHYRSYNQSLAKASTTPNWFFTRYSSGTFVHGRKTSAKKRKK